MRYLFILIYFLNHIPGYAQQNRAMGTNASTQIDSSQSQDSISANNGNGSIPQLQITQSISGTDTLPNALQKSIHTFYDSLFAVNNLETGTEEFISTHKKQSNYILPVMLFILLLYFTWLRYQYAKQIRENITALLNSNLAQQFFRDREFSFNIFSVLLYVNAVFVFGLYIYQLCMYYGLELPFSSNLINLTLCITLFPAVYFIKSIVYFITNKLFAFDAIAGFFRFNTLIIYQLLAIGLIPCILLMATVQQPVLHGVILFSYGLIAFAFLVRLFKGFAIGLAFTRFHVLYFFMYICALEIAPLLILYKTFVIYAI